MGFFSEHCVPLIKPPTASDFLNNLDEEKEAFPSIMPNMISQLGTEVMWDKIRPKRMPCKCYIECLKNTNEVTWQEHAKFSPSQTKDSPQQHGPWATFSSAAVLTASCGVAQLHSLGSASWENSPVGKHHVGNLAGSGECLHSAPELLPCTVSLIHAALHWCWSWPQSWPYPQPGHPHWHFSARHRPLWELTPATGTRPSLLFGLGVPRGCSLVPAARHSSCPLPRGTDPSHPLTQGQRVTDNPGNLIFCAFTPKKPSGFHYLPSWNSEVPSSMNCSEKGRTLKTGISAFFLIIVPLNYSTFYSCILVSSCLLRQ